MANTDILGPRKTMFVLVIVVGCLAVLWPRILYPIFAGNVKDQIRPNQYDKAAGCCDMIFETDINAIKIITELCSSIILQKQSGIIDVRTKLAFQSGKLPKDVINMCWREVNSTCGIDISTFLDQNIKLGKTYRQILEEVRSYNSSTCLKLHFGVPSWALGGTHYVASSWAVVDSTDNVKQERPPHLRAQGPHPAMQERGRAIVPPGTPRPAPPQAPPPVVQRMAERRVRDDKAPLSFYYNQIKEPVIPGVRPPMGGAGGVVPAPKSSMGLVMPIYTICIMMFFVYTLCKLLFRKTSEEHTGPYDNVKPDPLFRQRVFGDERVPARVSTERNNLGHKESDSRDKELDMLKAKLVETERAMATILQQLKGSSLAETTNHTNNHSHTNGSVPHEITSPSNNQFEAKPENTENVKDDSSQHETTPIPTWKEKVNETITSEHIPEIEKVFKEKYNSFDENDNKPESELLQKNKTEVKILKEEIPTASDSETPPTDFLSIEGNEIVKKTEDAIEETINKPIDMSQQCTSVNVFQSSIEEKPINDNVIEEMATQILDHISNDVAQMPEKDDDILNEGSENEELSEEEIEYEEDNDDIEESPALKPLILAKEGENATVKVLGMEMTAQCEGGGRWAARPPASPPAPPHSPAAEVSSIFLSGSLPHQSRLLVAESETHAEKNATDGKDSPVVLSGKMTLSVINDELGEESPEKDTDTGNVEDEDFTTASAATMPKKEQQGEEEDLSEGEQDAEDELEEEEIELEEIEVTDEEVEEEIDFNNTTTKE